MKYKTIFFDLDGTITDSAPGIMNSIKYALEKNHLPMLSEEQLRSFIGPPLRGQFCKVCGLADEESARMVEDYREYYRDKGIFGNNVYDGVIEMLEKLRKKGFRLAIATSKPEKYAKIIIDHFHLTQYFACVAGMEMDGGRGTKAQVITYALEKNDITDKSNVLMIGDREHDVIGAHENGLDCLGILYGFGSRKEFEEAGADYIRENVEDILQFV